MLAFSSFTCRPAMGLSDRRPALGTKATRVACEVAGTGLAVVDSDFRTVADPKTTDGSPIPDHRQEE